MQILLLVTLASVTVTIDIASPRSANVDTIRQVLHSSMNTDSLAICTLFDGTAHQLTDILLYIVRHITAAIGHRLQG